MIRPEYVRVMAQYNQTMNQRLFEAAARLTDEQRREDIGLFWQSLHGTLCHLLWGDRQWMARFDDWTPNTTPNSQSAELIADFSELRTARTEADAAIVDFAGRVNEQWLSEDLTWFSGSAKAERRMSKRLLVTHLFNHQTHHRGQAHAALTRFGADPGDTDLFLVVPQG